jgi:hypothetical protein
MLVPMKREQQKGSIQVTNPSQKNLTAKNSPLPSFQAPARINVMFGSSSLLEKSTLTKQESS